MYVQRRRERNTLRSARYPSTAPSEVTRNRTENARRSSSATNEQRWLESFSGSIGTQRPGR